MKKLKDNTKTVLYPSGIPCLLYSLKCTILLYLTSKQILCNPEDMNRQPPAQKKKQSLRDIASHAI